MNPRPALRRPARHGVMIAGGGTAGHVVPGLAIAEALVESGWPRESVHFVGSRRGIETEMVPAAGFGLTALPGRGLNERRFSVANVLATIALGWGIARGVALVLARRPAVVVSLGGYAALAASLGALVWRVPVVVSEQNAVPSSTNRLVAGRAKASAVPFDGVDLPRPVVTGNPIRREIVAAAAQGASRPWPSGRFAVVVFGGSLGSARINGAVWGGLDQLAERDDVFVYHVVGRRDWSTTPSGRWSRELYQPVEYDSDLATALASADLVVSRAGGSTVAELAVIGVGAVLVPLPIATHDHQTHNAAALASVGAARVVRDDEFDAARLVSEITRGIEGGATAGAAAARTVGRPRAAHDVAALVNRHARRRPVSVASA